jgi:hypothetical protein
VLVVEIQVVVELLVYELVVEEEVVESLLEVPLTTPTIRALSADGFRVPIPSP